MLKADKDFLELLKEQHGIKITLEDLNCIHEFQYFQELERKEKLAKTHVNDLDVQQLPVIGVIAGGVLGGFVGPLIGIGWLSAALIGASIGWRFLGGGQKKQAPEQEQTKKRGVSSVSFGFNTAPSIVPLGGAIALVYTNNLVNVNGGVRTSGNILNSRVETVSGLQKLNVLYGLCLGTIQSVDISKTLIDNQTIDTFFTDEIFQDFRQGSVEQTSVFGFNYYSQVNNLSSNAFFGLSFKQKTINPGSYFGDYLQINLDNLGVYNLSDRCAIFNTSTGALQGFKFTSLTPFDTDKLSISQTIFIDALQPIFGLHDAKFRTTKKCTEIHINFVFKITARDENNENLYHAILFDLYIDDIFVCVLYVGNNSDSEQKRAIKLRNLVYQKHKIEFKARFKPVIGLLTYVIDVVNDVYFGTGLEIGGKFVEIATGGYAIDPAILISQAAYEYTDIKKYLSNENSPPCKITTINEIVHPSDLGHSTIATYPGVALAALTVFASDRIQGDPAPSFFISRGRIIKNFLVAGVAGNGSNGATLNDLSKVFTTETPSNASDNFRINTYIRNLDKQLEAFNYQVYTNQIIATSNLQFEPGDRYVIYELESSNYFPDIFCDLLISKVGGLASFLPSSLIQDFFIDFESIVNARKYCITNNYFWDSAIDLTINFEEFVTRESIGSLLFPSRVGGRYGLIPEQQTNPVAIFSASNIIENTYSEENIQIDNLNCIHVTFNDGTDDLKPRVVSIMTEAAYNGTEPLFPESLKFDSITNQAQAEKVGKIYLKSRLLQTKVVSFSTGLQGFGVREGDLILVQYIITETLNEFSGSVVAVEPWNSDYQDVLLSVPMPVTLPANYPGVSTYKLSNKIIESNLTCTLVLNDNRVYLRIHNIENALEIADYVLLTNDVTHRKTFRVQKITPQDDGSVTVNAVLWVPEILDGSDLFVVD